ncbi:uncharacterized protein LOC107048701 isoform X1 [Diachasma alloeum]|uniref:uncharacterized protein LOC107048701 isoform X1 n=1 Tax=Diachasma alloeum TaxID=454923 RepID=UPI0007383D8A|nr:uncharacterized protein LOC107048701 isoform X1 [Diachasma alloeum]
MSGQLTRVLRTFRLFKLLPCSSFRRHNQGFLILKILGNQSPPGSSIHVNSSMSSRKTWPVLEPYHVNYEDLLDAQKDNSVLIIDVREQKEIDETGKLPGSIHIPTGNVSKVLETLPDDEFQKQSDKPKPKDINKIILSCRTGIITLATTILTLLNLNYWPFIDDLRDP